MTIITHITAAALIATLLMGCQDKADGNAAATNTHDTTGTQQVTCHNCGEVESIMPVRVKGDPRPGAALAGAVIGGVIGHQFGSGSGNDAATAAGAVGGAVAGSEIDRKHNSKTLYEVVVRMPSGERIQRTVGRRDGLAVGDDVRLQGEQIIPVS